MIITTTVDDIDASQNKHTLADETVTFGLRGQAYEVDLAGENLELLEKALEPFIKVARKVPSLSMRKSSPSQYKRSPASTAYRAGLRKWSDDIGAEQGYTYTRNGDGTYNYPRATRDAYDSWLASRENAS